MSDKKIQTIRPADADETAAVTNGGDTAERLPWSVPDITELAVSRTYAGTPGPNDGANPYT